MSTRKGRPSGTTASDGYAVSTSGGRPSGTKASDGCSVGGRGRVKQIQFDQSIDLPSEWDLSDLIANYWV